MPGLHDGAPDPLTALRSSDRRPRSEVWRDRLTSVGRDDVSAFAGRAAAVGLLVALGLAVGWRVFVESEPPVEASIPFAAGIAEQPVVDTADAIEPTDLPPAEATSPLVQPNDGSAPGADPGVEVVVHVAGAVAEPGVIEGLSTWRIDDALRAVGGPTASADLDRINLAALIADGQRIYVPHLDQDVPGVVAPDSGVLAEPGGSSVDTSPVNLNTADASGLEQLPGVGPATAAAIISHREEHGSFGTVDSLVAVSGIGPATLDALRDHVVV